MLIYTHTLPLSWTLILFRESIYCTSDLHKVNAYTTHTHCKSDVRPSMQVIIDIVLFKPLKTGICTQLAICFHVCFRWLVPKHTDWEDLRYISFETPISIYLLLINFMPKSYLKELISLISSSLITKILSFSCSTRSSPVRITSFTYTISIAIFMPLLCFKNIVWSVWL